MPPPWSGHRHDVPWQVYSASLGTMRKNGLRPFGYFKVGDLGIVAFGLLDSPPHLQEIKSIKMPPRAVAPAPQEARTRAHLAAPHQLDAQPLL